MEIEEAMALALSKGSRVESGLHKAELIPERRRSGSEIILKLIITALFIAMLPSVCSRNSAFKDVNRDGKIDILDFLESARSPASPSGRRHWSIKA